MDRRLDAARLRGLTQRRLSPSASPVSRREFLRLSGLSAATLAFAAACGTDAGQSTPRPPTAEQFWSSHTRNGRVNWANWPLYMDTENYPELRAFTDQTGTTVNYQEVINDNVSWLEEIRPKLQANESIGYDLMVVSHGIEFREIVRSGFLAPLDHSQLPNFASFADVQYRTSLYDPGNVYSIPYASGLTGIAYDPAKTGRPITKLSDLWSDEFAGRVAMPADIHELSNFGLLLRNFDPARSTPADWEQAAAALSEQRERGIVHGYYGQEYIDMLLSGEVWISWAWSGDIYQLNATEGTDFQFVMPEEGGNLWVDAFTIPITAENPLDALDLMDFFYRPEIAASIIEWHTYISPVPAAKEVIAEKVAQAGTDEDREFYEGILDNPFVFPDEATFGRAHQFVDPETPALIQQFQSTFEPIFQG